MFLVFWYFYGFVLFSKEFLKFICHFRHIFTAGTKFVIRFLIVCDQLRRIRKCSLYKSRKCFSFSFTFFTWLSLGSHAFCATKLIRFRFASLCWCFNQVSLQKKVLSRNNLRPTSTSLAKSTAPSSKSLAYGLWRRIYPLIVSLRIYFNVMIRVS